MRTFVLSLLFLAGFSFSSEATLAHSNAFVKKVDGDELALNAYNYALGNGASQN